MKPINVAAVNFDPEFADLNRNIERTEEPVGLDTVGGSWLLARFRPERKIDKKADFY